MRELIYEKLYSSLCKNSMEAAKTYYKAFDAEITLEMKNDSGTIYEHYELSINDKGFLAIGEAKNPCDVGFVHKMKWETMTFNVFEMGTEDSVQRVFDDNFRLLETKQEERYNEYITSAGKYY